MAHEHSHQNPSTLFVFMKNTPWYTGEVSYIWKALFKEWHRQPSPQGIHTASRFQLYVQFPRDQLRQTGKTYVSIVQHLSHCFLFPPETEGQNVEVMEWKVCARLVSGGRGGYLEQSCQPSIIFIKESSSLWDTADINNAQKLPWKHIKCSKIGPPRLPQPPRTPQGLSYQPAQFKLCIQVS